MFETIRLHLFHRWSDNSLCVSEILDTNVVILHDEDRILTLSRSIRFHNTVTGRISEEGERTCLDLESPRAKIGSKR